MDLISSHFKELLANLRHAYSVFDANNYVRAFFSILLGLWAHSTFFRREALTVFHIDKEVKRLDNELIEQTLKGLNMSNAVSGKIGDFGTYSLDIDIKGTITAEIDINKDFGYAKVTETTKIEMSLLDVAAAIAAKTSTTWDDKAISTLRTLLGIADPTAPVPPAA